MVGAVGGFPFEGAVLPHAPSSTLISQIIAVAAISLARTLNGSSPGNDRVARRKCQSSESTCPDSLHSEPKNRTCSIGQIADSQPELVVSKIARMCISD